jgi:hypothetical protein
MLSQPDEPGEDNRPGYLLDGILFFTRIIHTVKGLFKQAFVGLPGCNAGIWVVPCVPGLPLLSHPFRMAPGSFDP